MGERTNIKAWAVGYDTATNTVLATMDYYASLNPKFITVKLSDNGMKFIEKVGLGVIQVTDTNYVFSEGHSVVFWDVRYTGATEEGEMWNYEADYMMFT